MRTEIAARLVITSRDGQRREMVLNKMAITIGRAPQNEIVFDDSAVSGQHAVISVKETEALLEDLDSTNGTKVNGQPVKRHFLQDGDIVELGRYTILYLRF